MHFVLALYPSPVCYELCSLEWHRGLFVMSDFTTILVSFSSDLESFPDEILMIKKDGWSAVLNGVPQAIVDINILHKSQRHDMPSGYKMTQLVDY